MVRGLRAALAFGLMICITPFIAKAADDQPGQQPKVFEKQITVKLDYLLFLPEGYSNDSDKKWPLMLFLHAAPATSLLRAGLWRGRSQWPASERRHHACLLVYGAFLRVRILPPAC